MNLKEELSEQSKIRELIIQAELALKENHFEQALTILKRINLDEMKKLSQEELQAIGNLLTCLRDIAEEKKSSIVAQLNTINASKKYLG